MLDIINQCWQFDRNINEFAANIKVGFYMVNFNCMISLFVLKKLKK